MATVIKLWRWTSDPESWVPFTIGIDTWVSGDGAALDGSSDPGCLQIQISVSNPSETWSGPPGTTWETLGVPPGSTVTNVQASCMLKVQTAPVTPSTFEFFFGSGFAYQIPGLIFISEWQGLPATWVRHDGLVHTVPLAYRPSSSHVGPALNAAGNTLGRLRIDSLQLTITYTPPRFTTGVAGASGRAAITNLTPTIFPNGGNPIHMLGGSVGRAAAHIGDEALFLLYFAGAKNFDDFTKTNYGIPTPIHIENPQPGQERWVDVHPPVDLAQFVAGNMGDVRLRRRGPDQTYSGGIVFRGLEIKYRKKAGT